MTGPLHYPSIVVTTLIALYRAYNANKKGDNSWIPLPPVAPSIQKPFQLEKLAAVVDSIVRVIVFNTAHPCLYYSYARCCVLRKNGYSVLLNIGMHNLQGGLHPEGHCWLSYKGRVVFEEKDPHEMYSEKLGECDDVIYWGRLKGVEGKEFLRKKKE